VAFASELKSWQMADARFESPTRTGELSGRDAATGIRWAFEPPEQHWANHDRRQLSYWRARNPEERLAQADEYRRRVHGDLVEPARWSWRLLPPGE